MLTNPLSVYCSGLNGQLVVNQKHVVLLQQSIFAVILFRR